MRRSSLFHSFNHHHHLSPEYLKSISRTFSSQLTSNNHHHLISLISTSKTLKHILQIHTQLIVSGFQHDNFTNTHLINSYSLYKKINLARLVFNVTPNPNVMLWNSIIKAHIRSKQYQEAIIMYNKMVNNDYFLVQPDKYTYTFVLKACTMLLDIKEGIFLHEQIVKRKLESDIFIGTGLIDMYCKCGQLVNARQVFDKMPDRDVAVWNAMIAGLSQSLDFDQAIEVFQSMQDKIKPNSVSLMNLFPAIYKSSNVRLCKCVHGYVIRRIFPNTVVNGLIDVYSKCKRTDFAYRVFDLMQEPDDVSWGTLMAGFALNGCHYQVLELFNLMKNNNLNVNIVSIISALTAAGETRDLETGKTIHEFVNKYKFDSDIRVSTPLITMYAKCGELKKGQDLFNNLSGKDMISWSAVIAAFTQSNYHLEAISLFRDMQYAGFKPSMVTIVGVLPACGELCSENLGKSLHCYAIKHDIDYNMSIETSLVAMYAKCDDFNSAMIIFENMVYKEVVAWNALINRYAQIGEPNLAMNLFCRLRLTGVNVNPDPGTMVGVVSASAHITDLNLGASVHGLVMKYGFESDSHVNNALIDMYSKSQSLSSAELLFGLTKIKDLVIWNVMINAYMRNGCGQESIFTFHKMKYDGFTPSLVTFVSLLPSVANLAAIKEGTSLHGNIIRLGFFSHTVIGNGLIDMYSKCGRVDLSEAVFNEIKDKDTVSWNIMLSGYGLNGLGDYAFNFFEHMQDNLVEIDPVSFISVLSACRHACLVNEGKKVFNLMKEKHNIEPKIEHYACMVDLLGRAGLFDETLGLIGSMPMEPDCGIWGSLLGACQMHSNVRLAEVALENLVKLEPRNQTHYVVLSGIYAESGRWADARKLRMKMVETGVKKTPGCSWVNEKRDFVTPQNLGSVFFF